MSLSASSRRLPRLSLGRPYARLLSVKMKSGRSYFLTAELWHLLPKDDTVVAVTNVQGRPIFAPVHSLLATDPSPVRN